jgi:hypothetical protein
MRQAQNAVALLINLKQMFLKYFQSTACAKSHSKQVSPDYTNLNKIPTKNQTYL